MLAFNRKFNPYSAAPPPPPSLPDYIISPSSIQPLSNEQAGCLIDSFLQTQGGKILILHRLADHLLGHNHGVDNEDIKELEVVLEEERRREGGVIHVQPEDTNFEENINPQKSESANLVPSIETDKKRARKEERKMKKEKEREKREKRKRDENEQKVSDSPKVKKVQKTKKQ